MSVGNSCLSLVVALKDRSMVGGVSPKFKTLLITLTSPKICFSVFSTKNSPLQLIVNNSQLYRQNSKLVLPVSEFFFF